MTCRRIFSPSVAFLLLLFSGGRIRAQETDLSEKVAAKYKTAKELQEAGKYDKAILAFTEIKALQYHPILDYRIGYCHEQLAEHKQAISFYQLYVKYYGTRPPGKNHPTVEEVKAKITKLQAILASKPRNVPGSRSKEPVHASPGGSGSSPTLPVKSSPGASKPGPGNGPKTASSDPSTQDPGYPPPPPPPPTVKKEVFPKGRALYLTLDLGFNPSTADLAEDHNGSAGFFIGLYYRPIIYISAGGLIGVNSYVPKEENSNSKPMAINLMLDLRAHMPLGRWSMQAFKGELWAGALFGYSMLKARMDPLSGASGDILLKGPGVGASIGADLSMARWLTLGLAFRVIKPFFRNGCGKDAATGKEICWSEKTLSNMDAPTDSLVIYLGIAATIRFFLF